MKHGPQSSTFHAGRYGLPQRPGTYAATVDGGEFGWKKLEPAEPKRVNGWLVGLGIVLMCVAAIGVAFAIALESK